MSVEHLAIVLHHSRAVGTEKVVLIGIANHDGDGGAFPAHSTLAKYANVDVSNVRKALRKLVMAGELRIEERFTTAANGAVLNTTNRYHILVQCPADCDRSAQHRIAVQKNGKAPAPTPLGGSALPPLGADAHPPWAPAPTKPSTNHPEEPLGTQPRRKPETTIPDEWKPTTAHQALADELGVGLADEAFRFRNHAEANDTRWRSWDAAFRNWLKNAEKYRRVDSSPDALPPLNERW